MFQTKYFIDKRSSTSADALLAAGFARLLQTVLIQLGKPADALRIEDAGPYYLIELGEPLTDEAVAQLQPFAFVQHLATDTQKQALGEYYERGFPYEQQRQQRDSYRAKLRELPPAARNPDARLFGHPALEQLAQEIVPPDTLLPLYLVINQMKVTPSFNEPVVRWLRLSPPALHAHVRLLLALFATHPNPYDQVLNDGAALAKHHKLGNPDMTMLQVVNPTTGKGANRTKANALSIGGQDNFWLLELLKFAGFFTLAHPQTIVNTKDRKTYVLKPRSIRLREIDELMRAFRNVLWSSTPAKLDILAALQFTRVFVEHERRQLTKGGPQPHRRLKPTDRVHGFDVTFYKDMGSAFAVMNVAALNLPEWIPPIESVTAANRALAVLQEHIKVIGTIAARDGSERTDEYELLSRYRDFLSGRSIEPFLDFAALFAPYISRKIERNEPIRRFSVDALKELFVMSKHDFMPVITNSGFQNIASAIRKSTVSLQFDKGSGRPVRFDIRYGLTQELVRRSNYAEDFIEVLSEFIASYNAESAQTFETSKGTVGRKRVTKDDLAQIMFLLSQGYSPKTLARLLVAFGTAKVGDANEPGDADADGAVAVKGTESEELA